jgi:phosphatidylglycerophosphate synthase
MTATSDLQYTVALAVIVALLAVAYGLRLAIKGRVHFDRIDRQGGSRLLSKGAMELGYWALQPVARLMVVLGITPNEVSCASLGFGFLSAASLTAGRFGLGAVFATIAGLLDALDGMVARISGLASDTGQILDAAVDRYVEFFFLSGLVLYYRERPVLQVLTLLALLGSFMVSYSTAKAEAFEVNPPRGSMRRPERAIYLTLGAALSAVTIPWLETHGEFSNPVGYPMVMALGLVAVVANVSAIDRFWSIAKTIRLREKHLTETCTGVSENALIEEPGDPQVSHQGRKI